MTRSLWRAVLVLVAFAGVACSSASGTPETPAVTGSCEPLVAAAPKGIASPDRATLADGLNAFLREMVLSERSDFTPRATPYLAGGNIWELEHFGHAHPFYAHLGKVDGSTTVNLDGSQAFVDFVRASGVSLSDNAARVAYIKDFVLMDPRTLWIVEELADFHFIVPRDADELTLTKDEMDVMAPMIFEEIERRNDVERRFLRSIRPICLSGSGPFRGVLHAIHRQQRLMRIEVTLQTSGSIEVSEKLLAEQVPVTMVSP